MDTVRERKEREKVWRGSTEIDKVRRRERAATERRESNKRKREGESN